jgi:hypothetical protein
MQLPLDARRLVAVAAANRARADRADASPAADVGGRDGAPGIA